MLVDQVPLAAALLERLAALGVDVPAVLGQAQDRAFAFRHRESPGHDRGVLRLLARARRGRRRARPRAAPRRFERRTAAPGQPRDDGRALLADPGRGAAEARALQASGLPGADRGRRHRRRGAPALRVAARRRRAAALAHRRGLRQRGRPRPARHRQADRTLAHRAGPPARRRGDARPPLRLRDPISARRPISWSSTNLPSPSRS